MLKIENERAMSRFLSIGTAVVTSLVVTSSLTDPVNVTKLFALGGIALGLFAVILISKPTFLLKANKSALVMVVLFLCASVNSVLNSDSPMTQLIYGVYGRNTGFLTYTYLLILFIAALTLSKRKCFETVIMGFFAAGAINLVYCLWVIAFGDFLSWQNQYGNILGTFGNPNFSGSFLAMITTSICAYLFKPDLDKKVRLALVGVVFVGVFEVYKSQALQGRVLLLFGLGFLFLLLILNKHKLLPLIYLTVVAVVAVVAVMGTLQKGPLAGLLYKTSVSLRGQYWLAGWNMGESHPWAGVGFDSYGDWYRRARDARALISPGVNVTSNAAHNIPMDLFAFGGWPLLLSYVGIIILTIIAIVKVLRRLRTFDYLFAILSTAWLSYELQSLISINQIGLAIWGWVLSGLIIAYERMTRTDQEILNTPPNLGAKQKKYQQTQIISTGLVAGIGIVAGCIISAPPLAADLKFREAQESRDAVKFQNAVTPSFMNPQNIQKYGTVVGVFEDNQIFDKAHYYAQQAVKFNPEAYETWRVLYLISQSTPEEKSIALENMKRLDPLNPDVATK